MNINKLSSPSSEAEIKSHWKYKDKVYISCVCITFNHEFYISDAIDSMLAQVTDYRFEIIIHDDLSTDNTRDILIDYKRRYPSIIKLILQEENQYSKGKKITPIAVSYAVGEYIALCEGDDFWISKFKLNKQIQMLISYAHINVSIHKSYVISLKNSILDNIFYKNTSGSEVVEFKEVFKFGGQFAPTASMFIRKSVFDNIPNLYYTAPVGDFFIEVFSGEYGFAFIAEHMSCYRSNSIGSWTRSSFNTVDKKISYNINMLKSLDELSEYLNNLKYIKYKEQYIYFSLARLYLIKKEYKLCMKYWKLAFKGSININMHLKVIYTLCKTKLTKKESV